MRAGHRRRLGISSEAALPLSQKSTARLVLDGLVCSFRYCRLCAAYLHLPRLRVGVVKEVAFLNMAPFRSKNPHSPVSKIDQYNVALYETRSLKSVIS